MAGMVDESHFWAPTNGIVCLFGVHLDALTRAVLYGPQFLATKVFSTQFQKLKLSVSIFMAKSRYTNT